MTIDWEFLVHYFPFLVEGSLLTLKISVLSLLIGLVLGLIAALFKISSFFILRFLAGFYVWIIRSTPLLVQLFIIYFGLPQLGIDLGPLLSGILGLSLNVGAYNAETIRGGILSVSKGQWEAAHSLGMTRGQSLRRVILPQAIQVIIPPLGNNFVILIKDTSLVSTITLVELTLTAQRLISSTFKPFELYFMAAVLYALLTTSASLLLSLVESRYLKLRTA